MAQTQPSREVQHAAESGREDSTKPQQHKESGKAGSKAPELAKSDSARKRVQQLAADAADGADEALKKVAKLQAGVAEAVEEVVKTDKVAGDKANGVEKAAEHEDGPTKKSAKCHSEQSPGNNGKQAANGETKTSSKDGANGANHGENGARSINGGAVEDKGCEEEAIPVDTADPGHLRFNLLSGDSPSGHLDLNHSLQGSTLAGAVQEAVKAVDQAAGTGPGRDALAPATVKKGPAPMEEG
eukprot:TRINITY_DN9459_c0_g1_i1.p1 TRINITY_DN9459_c0_g1~~TRINITY_DN9459_c0_g1_i1.p1  ORF type:complete len:242 (+),score=58.62 TRINITY_DN9459_c0_g1_i1:176-901(+)